jgi:hypothetical protein
MKHCDMCPPGATAETETYRIRFDNLTVGPDEVSWQGELCQRHAAVIRELLAEGPPREGSEERHEAT